MNKFVYLGLSVLEIEIVMDEFWYDYLKGKDGKNKYMLHGYR